MKDNWHWFRIGFFACMGAVAFLGVVRLILWVLNMVFGDAPELPW